MELELDRLDDIPEQCGGGDPSALRPNLRNPRYPSPEPTNKQHWVETRGD